jgi:glycosyltransferase involved in cell wall biosynthesis
MRPITFLTILTAVGASTMTATSSRRRRRSAVVPSAPSAGATDASPGSVRLSVVVPAYREVRIGQTVQRLRAGLAGVDHEGGVEIVVVDDGSGDSTAALAIEAGADQVVELPENRGKGAAVRAGMLVARGRVACFTDADLSYSPDQIERLLVAVEDGWDVVIGNRDHEDARAVVSTSRLRSLGHAGMALLTRTVLRGRYRDTQCGLKAFRIDVARDVFALARVDRFAMDIEVLHLIERRGYSVTDVPVEVENHELSTVHVGRDTARMLRDLARIKRWGRQGHYDRPVPIAGYDGAPLYAKTTATGV